MEMRRVREPKSLRCSICGVLAEGYQSQDPQWAGTTVYVCQPCHGLHSDGRHPIPNFEVLEELERDAVGPTYKAMAGWADKVVKLKLIVPEQTHGPIEAVRFLRRVQQLAQVDHPNILHVLGCGESGGVLWVASEFVDGVSIRELGAREEGGLQLSDAADVMCQVLHALEQAHRLGLTHGALESRSVILTGYPGAYVARLADFGLSRSAQEAGLLWPRVSAPRAGDLYTPPERIIDFRRWGPAGDIYQAGAMLYWLLTGRHPYGLDLSGAAHDIRDPFRVILEGAPVPIRQCDHSIPDPLARAVDASLSRLPEERPATAGELAVVLRHHSSKTPAEGRQQEPEPAAPERPMCFDENVQFSVYRPKVVRPQKWYPLLAFAHLSQKPTDADDDEPDPVEEVERQARQVLRERMAEYRPSTQDASQAVPRGEELTFVPGMEGVEFNPCRRTFRWEKSIHREEFDLRAASELDGRTARGKLSVFLGAVLLADVNLTIHVDSGAEAEPERPAMEPSAARPYRSIFASYSHRDAAIVEQFENYARGLGDRYLRDCLDLRAGEAWSVRLEDMIRTADVFQLFWSSNSMRSPFVRQEWEFALSLGRSSFVRPTYWEQPLPESEDPRLPPEELRRIHFQYIGAGAADAHVTSRPTPTRPAEQAEAVARDLATAEMPVIVHKPREDVPEQATAPTPPAENEEEIITDILDLESEEPMAEEDLLSEIMEIGEEAPAAEGMDETEDRTAETTALEEPAYDEGALDEVLETAEEVDFGPTGDEFEMPYAAPALGSRRMSSLDRVTWVIVIVLAILTIAVLGFIVYAVFAS